MNVEKVLLEYQDMMKSIELFNVELNQLLKNKEKIHGTFSQEQQLARRIISQGLDPNLNAVQRISDKYDHYIEYISQKMSSLVEMKETLDKAIQSLPMEDYRLIDLVYIKKKKLSSIPRTLGIQESKIPGKLKHVIEKLETHIQQKNPV